MLRIRRLATAVVAGVAIALAFPDFGWWFTAFLGISMVSVLSRGVAPRAAFGLGWLAGLSFFLIHLWWAYVAVGPIPWVALSAAEAVAWGLVGLGFSAWTRSGIWGRFVWSGPLAFAALWTAAEALRSAWPFGGFPWGRLAFSAADAPTLGYAWLAGAPLVSFVTALVGAMLGQALVDMRSRRPVRALAGPLAAVLLVLAPIAFPLDSRAENGVLRVAWVQGNLANEGLDSFARAREVTQNHADASLDLASKPEAEGVDIVIWPENASDIDPRADAETAAVVTAAAAAFDAPVVLGSTDYTPVDGRYNMSLVWMPDGTQLQGQVYRKQVPAAFAEYIPMRSVARLFSSDVDRVTTDMIAGEGPARLDVPAAHLGRVVRIGPIICFEVAYDWISRQAIDEGAEFLAVQTNNATFGVTAESTQQLAMSKLRAVETGRATLQVSTVGVSAVISPDGRILDRAELFTRDAGVADLPLRSSLTPAMTIGAGFALAVNVIGGAVLAIGCVRAARRRELS